MAKLALVQENQEITDFIKLLLFQQKTNLHRFCKENNIDHQQTDYRIQATTVSWDYLSDLIKKINPKAVIKVDLDISVKVDGKEVFNQKIEE